MKRPSLVFLSILILADSNNSPALSQPESADPDGQQCQNERAAPHTPSSASLKLQLGRADFWNERQTQGHAAQESAEVGHVIDANRSGTDSRIESDAQIQ